MNPIFIAKVEDGKLKFYSQKEFNDYIKTLKPHSWSSKGKIRTSYKLPPEIKKEWEE